MYLYYYICRDAPFNSKKLQCVSSLAIQSKHGDDEAALQGA